MSVAGLFLAVDVLKFPYLPAFVCVFVATSVYSYLASRRYAFRTTRVGIRNSLARYLGITTAALLINSILLVLLVEKGGLRPVLGVVALALANAPVNFFAHRWLTFRIRSRTKPSCEEEGPQGMEKRRGVD